MRFPGSHSRNFRGHTRRQLNPEATAAVQYDLYRTVLTQDSTTEWKVELMANYEDYQTAAQVSIIRGWGIVHRNTKVNPLPDSERVYVLKKVCETAGSGTILDPQVVNEQEVKP